MKVQLALLAACTFPSSFLSADTPAPAAASVEAEQVDYRGELLRIAFEAASSLPIDPHVKNRARSQEEVVLGCLELERPELALEYAEAIPNWRKGACLAAVAAYRAERGETASVVELLERAERIAAGEEGELKQAWRRDRIRAKVSTTYSLLGRAADASRTAAGLTASEVGEVAVAEARSTDAESVDARLAELDTLVQTGEFEGVQTSLLTALEFHRLFFADEERRAVLEQRIESYATGIPLLVIMDARMGLVRNALEHGDEAEALRLWDEAYELFGTFSWDAEHGIPVRCDLAVLRAECGDRERAEKEIAAALELYEAGEKRILGTQRANTLRAVAEARADLDDVEEAAALYRRVTDIGAINTNARPRVSDLVKTCVSMAVHGFEPDEELMKTLREIHAGLTAAE